MSYDIKHSHNKILQHIRLHSNVWEQMADWNTTGTRPFIQLPPKLKFSENRLFSKYSIQNTFVWNPEIFYVFQKIAL